MAQKPIVIHVLGKETYDDAHIPGTINIPLDQLKQWTHGKDKHTPIVVYSASYSCPASSNAYHELKNLGFMNVKVYEGGVAEWYHKGFPTEGPAKLDYLKKSYAKAQDRGIEVMHALQLKELLGL